jgi:taurine dioxygenase
MATMNPGQSIAYAASGSLIEVSPAAARAFGAEVRNADVRSFDDWAFAALMRALLKHQVLLIQGQNLGEHDLHALGERIGAGELLYMFPGFKFGEPTSFCSLHAAYDALPPALRGRIAALKIGHSFDGHGLAMADVECGPASGRLRPLVALHPDTGRTMLALGERRDAYLAGLQASESDALLDELWEFAQQPEFVWSRLCRPGDLLIWDRRCTIRLQDMTRPSPPRLLHGAEIWNAMQA